VVGGGDAAGTHAQCGYSDTRQRFRLYCLNVSVLSTSSAKLYSPPSRPPYEQPWKQAFSSFTPSQGAMLCKNQSNQTHLVFGRIGAVLLMRLPSVAQPSTRLLSRLQTA